MNIIHILPLLGLKNMYLEEIEFIYIDPDKQKVVIGLHEIADAEKFRGIFEGKAINIKEISANTDESFHKFDVAVRVINEKAFIDFPISSISSFTRNMYSLYTK